MPRSAAQVLAFDRQHLFVLLDGLVDVVEVVAVGRGQLELGGQHDVEVFLRQRVELAAAEARLALEHLDQLVPLAALAVDALERHQRRQVRAVELESLAVVRGGLLGATELLLAELAELHVDVHLVFVARCHFEHAREHLVDGVPLAESDGTGRPSGSSPRGARDRAAGSAGSTGSRSPGARGSGRTTWRSAGRWRCACSVGICCASASLAVVRSWFQPCTICARRSS